MKKVNIRIYSFLNNIEENNEFLAIKSDNVIKYIDFSNNKMTIDLKNNIIIKDNDDYLFTLKFNDNIIEVFAKKLKKTFYKDIKTTKQKIRQFFRRILKLLFVKVRKVNF